MRTLWIAAAAVALAIAGLVLVLRSAADEPAVQPPPERADAAMRPPVSSRPVGSGPVRLLEARSGGEASPESRPPPTLAPGDAGPPPAHADEEMRAWARQQRAENAGRLTEARAEIRTRVRARVTEEVDGALSRLVRELAQARSDGDRGRIQALESRLADLRARRDTLIEERTDAIVAE